MYVSFKKGQAKTYTNIKNKKNGMRRGSSSNYIIRLKPKQITKTTTTIAHTAVRYPSL